MPIERALDALNFFLAAFLVLAALTSAGFSIYLFGMSETRDQTGRAARDRLTPVKG